MTNTTTAAQRYNARMDKIWETARRLKAERDAAYAAARAAAYAATTAAYAVAILEAKEGN